MEAEPKRKGVVIEGLVVVLGQSMFSLPKRQWFRLGASGLFYSSRDRGGAHGRTTSSESLIEFETMYLRVEKIEEKVSYRAEKITVHCLRVGDKRKCRILCFSTWEERDLWMTSVLTAIAKFKIFRNVENREELACGGKMHCNTPTASTPTLNRGRGKTSSLRFSRFGEGKSLRRRFTSLRTRKSMRESKTGNFNESEFDNDGRPGSGISYSSVFYKDVSDNSDVDEATTHNTRRLSETSSILSEDCPASPRIKPWLFEKLSSTVDFGMKRQKRHFSSFITKFT